MAYDGDEDGLQRLIDGLTGGRGLYRWQERLLRSWLNNTSWDAVDVPTGLGKTTVITLWLIARAAGADLSRRLIYVVDRRAVVDQSTTEAEQVAARLDALIDGDPKGPEWRDRLGLTHRPGKADGRPDHWLPISTLRGQHLDNRRWMENPGGAAIVVGTVDMIGSRLLFAGYGVSRWTRPMHAGLIGLDSLVVLDEAHLVPPFEALVRKAGELAGQDAKASPAPTLAPPLRLMSLSATGQTRTGAEVFRLTPDDDADAAVGKRLSASKRLIVLPEASPKDIATKLADQAWEFRDGPDGATGRRVVVYCNRRQTAQDVEEILRKRARDKAHFGKDAHLTALLVGERRYRERLELTGEKALGIAPSPVFARFQPGAEADPEGRPAFLVATSAGEVGVDLDADDMVGDLVAWERMVQRLGRVNRRTEPGEARIAVIPVAKEKEAEDEIEDADLARYRAPFDSPLWPAEDGARDVSPGRLAALKTSELKPLLDAATTPEPLRPPLTPPTVQAWALTSLEHHPGRPKIAPWLRGWDRDRPQTTVLWRRLFPLHEHRETVTTELRDFFAAAPPHYSESLDAPTWRVAALLKARAKAITKAEQNRRKTPGGEAEMPDYEEDEADAALAATEAGSSSSAASTPKHAPVVVVLASDRTVAKVYTRGQIEADKGDLERDLAYGTAVIDARFGGLDKTGLLRDDAGEPPETVDMDGDGWRLPLDRTIGRRISFGPRPKTPARSRDGYWKTAEFSWSASDTDDAMSLWVDLWRGRGETPGDAAISRTPQKLTDHHADTGVAAGRIADALGLPPPWRALLVAAAEAHDLGKARTLWQEVMGADKDGRPYAKTTGGGDGRRLNGYRHEFGSMREVLAAPQDWLSPGIVADPAMLDLALHLIVAHHGRGRPTIAPYDPDQLPSLSAPVARDVALRFARLQAAWGPWGLAWWEALLRAADQAASRALNEAGDGEARPQAAPTREAAHG